jgi:Na+-translocating ferredoxin:NAD+ oxidoreductase RnfD subunit
MLFEVGGVVAERAITIRGTSYPVILPRLGDPRLHVAVVTLTVHLLGQVGLHFRLSVPQILAAILTAAVIEMAITFRQQRAFIWPASAMLTASGVALILRVPGMPANEPWNMSYLPLYAGVSVFALLTKYLIKYRGSHVFNPSNLGLVVTFIVLGNARVEPLDLWWVPISNVWMILAYLVIILGSSALLMRAGLFAMSVAYYLTLAAGMAVLAASGHCITANWAFAPVCGADYWRVIVTSPEVLIYAAFMVTDPRVIPRGKVGKVVFGIGVGVLCTLFMAPQTDEFGTKVGLLAGLVPLCAGRYVFERWLPQPKTAADNLIGFGRRLVTGGSGTGLARRAGGVGALAVVVLVWGSGVVLAGTPARGVVAVNTSEAMLEGAPTQLDPSTLPPITVTQPVWDWDQEIAGSAQQLLVTLAQNLELENQALLKHDPSLLTAVDHGARLAEMQALLAQDEAAGTVTVTHCHFAEVTVRLLVPFGVQTGLSLAFDSKGTMTQQTYDASGSLVSEQTVPFAQTFAIRRATGARWLTVAALDYGASS